MNNNKEKIEFIKVPENNMEKRIYQPQEEKILWRYLDIIKFLDLIQTSELHFSQIKNFTKDDPFEGTYPPVIKALYKEFMNDEHFKKFWSNNEQGLASIYVNCWHCNKFESLGMWARYANSNSGLLIKTNEKRLHNSIKEVVIDGESKTSGKIYFGDVKYMDLDETCTDRDRLEKEIESFTKTDNRAYAYIKRMCFEYEKEYRLVIDRYRYIEDDDNKVNEFRKNWDNEKYRFLRVKVDLQELIDEIYISPMSMPNYENIIKKFVEENNLKNIIIKKSSILTNKI